MKITDTYNGGKSASGTYQQIINHIPPHNIYIEPFAGHGGIFRHKKLAALNILNDKDTAIYQKWIAHGKKTNGAIYQEQFIQASLFDKPGKPVVILRNNDYSHIIAKFMDNPEAFIYCDPPYLMSSRRAQQKLYRFEWEGEQEHIELAGMLHNCKCAVMISSLPNSLYESLYKSYNSHEFNNTVRHGSQREIIYFNYPPPEVLHDCQYLGKNYRDREDIKRMVKRWRKKLQTLPARKRVAILSDIVNNFKDTTEKLIQL
jgi:DNA adenine methylase